MVLTNCSISLPLSLAPGICSAHCTHRGPRKWLAGPAFGRHPEAPLRAQSLTPIFTSIGRNDSGREVDRRAAIVACSAAQNPLVSKL